MSNVTLTDIELEAIWSNIRATRNRSAGMEVPTPLIVDNLAPTIEKIIARRLTAQRQWVGGRDA